MVLGVSNDNDFMAKPIVSDLAQRARVFYVQLNKRHKLINIITIARAIFGSMYGWVGIQ